MNCSNHPDVVAGVRACAGCQTMFCSDCLVEIRGEPFCATCKSEQLLDVRSGIDRTALQFAATGRRFVALLVDGFLWLATFILFLLGVMLGSTGREEPPCGLGFYFLLGWMGAAAYEALLLKTQRGQTIGKMVMKLRVVSRDGGDLSTGQAWGRAVGRVLLTFVPVIGLLVDYVPAYFTAERTTIHDMLAQTRVVMWA